MRFKPPNRPMDGEAVGELFASLGSIRTRKMFGGQGIYRDDTMFALEAYGELHLKADAHTVSLFEAAGSRPFTYQGGGKPVTTSYWRLPDEALDDPERAEKWGRLALEAAMRAKSIRCPKRIESVIPKGRRL